MKKSFLNLNRPLITIIFYAKTPEQALETILPSLPFCDAYCWQLDFMDGKYRTRQEITHIIEAMGDHPCYVTNYRKSNVCPQLSDNERMHQLLLALDCGATLIDIPGDECDPSPDEMSYNSSAVKMQKDFIKEVHNRGGEALMSSHICSFRTTEQVYNIANIQAERGADIAKIVTAADNEIQLNENFRTTIYLREHLSVKSLFLCGGKYNMLHRKLGPLLGSCIYLCRWIQSGDDISSFLQPDIFTARTLMKNTGFFDIP